MRGLEVVIGIFGVLRYLSLTDGGSSTKASLGGESGVVVEVTHNGAEPTALLATQPVGSAGAVTESKFSANEEHGVGEGVGVGGTVAVGVGEGVPVEVAVAVGVGDGVPVKITSAFV